MSRSELGVNVDQESAVGRDVILGPRGFSSGVHLTCVEEEDRRLLTEVLGWFGEQSWSRGRATI